VAAVLEKFSKKETLKAEAGRDERLLAALVHLTILLNTVTYIGGILVCAVAYFFARRKALFLAEQASRSLVYQSIIWGLIIAGWMIYRLFPDWLGGILFWPLWALVWIIAILRAMWRAARSL
jgi:uncharacterized Tic20 family protein